jgi:glycosyltransferase involved in cell wall biosynthesis
MNNKPLVSIISSAYNNARDLTKMIQSVLDQAVNEIVYYWRKHTESFSRKINFNPLRNQCHQFCYLLYEQRKIHGKDDLTGLESGELAKLRQSISDQYTKDPSRIYRDICNSRDLDHSIRMKHGIESIKLNPFYHKNYYYFIKSFFRR